VGPDSAGSNPGPACYGRGGEAPTVTDADVVLGYINPRNFLGGKLRLDAQRAERAIAAKVAEPLGLSIVDAAWRIKSLIDGFMGQEIYRICALSSGQDPRDFVLFALGGAGPVHATGYAHAADVTRVATFPFSSVFGAFSTLNLDILQSYERTLALNFYSHKSGAYAVDSIPPLNEAVEALVSFGRRDMEEEGFDMNAVELQLDLYMCYGQQRQTLPVRSKKLRLESADDLGDLCNRFNAAYGEKYGIGAVYPEAGIEMVSIRLNAVGPVAKYKMHRMPAIAGSDVVPAGTRKAYWGPAHGFLETPVHQLGTLGAGVAIEGPVLCESDDTVIVTPPGWRFRADEWGVGWIERGVANPSPGLS